MMVGPGSAAYAGLSHSSTQTCDAIVTLQQHVGREGGQPTPATGKNKSIDDCSAHTLLAYDLLVNKMLSLSCVNLLYKVYLLSTFSFFALFFDSPFYRFKVSSSDLLFTRSSGAWLTDRLIYRPNIAYQFAQTPRSQDPNLLLFDTSLSLYQALHVEGYYTILGP